MRSRALSIAPFSKWDLGKVSVAPRRHGCLLTSTIDEDETDVNTREESQLITVVEYLFFFVLIHLHMQNKTVRKNLINIQRFKRTGTHFPVPDRKRQRAPLDNPLFPPDISLSISLFFTLTLSLRCFPEGQTPVCSGVRVRMQNGPRPWGGQFNTATRPTSKRAFLVPFFSSPPLSFKQQTSPPP